MTTPTIEHQPLVDDEKAAELAAQFAADADAGHLPVVEASAADVEEDIADNAAAENESEDAHYLGNMHSYFVEHNDVGPAKWGQDPRNPKKNSNTLAVADLNDLTRVMGELQGEGEVGEDGFHDSYVLSSTGERIDAHTFYELNHALDDAREHYHMEPRENSIFAGDKSGEKNAEGKDGNVNAKADSAAESTDDNTVAEVNDAAAKDQRAREGRGNRAGTGPTPADMPGAKTKKTKEVKDTSDAADNTENAAEAAATATTEADASEQPAQPSPFNKEQKAEMAARAKWAEEQGDQKGIEDYRKDKKGWRKYRDDIAALDAQEDAAWEENETRADEGDVQAPDSLRTQLAVELDGVDTSAVDERRKKVAANTESDDELEARLAKKIGVNLKDYEQYREGADKASDGEISSTADLLAELDAEEAKINGISDIKIGNRPDVSFEENQRRLEELAAQVGQDIQAIGEIRPGGNPDVSFDAIQDRLENDWKEMQARIDAMGQIGANIAPAALAQGEQANGADAPTQQITPIRDEQARRDQVTEPRPLIRTSDGRWIPAPTPRPRQAQPQPFRFYPVAGANANGQPVPPASENETTTVIPAVAAEGANEVIERPEQEENLTLRQRIARRLGRIAASTADAARDPLGAYRSANNRLGEIMNDPEKGRRRKIAAAAGIVVLAGVGVWAATRHGVDHSQLADAPGHIGLDQVPTATDLDTIQAGVGNGHEDAAGHYANLAPYISHTSTGTVEGAVVDQLHGMGIQNPSQAVIDHFRSETLSHNGWTETAARNLPVNQQVNLIDDDQIRAWINANGNS